MSEHYSVVFYAAEWPQPDADKLFKYIQIKLAARFPFLAENIHERKIVIEKTYQVLTESGKLNTVVDVEVE